MTIQTTDDNMTQGEILVMARQVGYTPFEALKWEQALTDFAKLVVTKATEREREACAKLCEDFADVDSGPDGIMQDYHAYLIRARGTTE